jgi:hypothetical protein
MEFSTGSNEKQSIEIKTTLDKGGDVYLALTSTQLDQYAWLIYSGESYHMTHIENGYGNMNDMKERCVLGG